MSAQRLRKAFAHMLELIAQGVEYPDAQWQISEAYAVSYEDLRTMYEEQDDNRRKD